MPGEFFITKFRPMGVIQQREYELQLSEIEEITQQQWLK